jgi:hypothetical protein
MRSRPSREELPNRKPFPRYTGPPMTLGNMRANGVSRLTIYCERCHHEALLDVGDFADDVPVPTFGPRMACSACGTIGADVRPNWSERQADGAVRR